MITILRPEFGWTQIGNVWSYDPTHRKTDLKSIWQGNLASCVQHDKASLRDCFCNSTTHPTTAYVGPEAIALPDNIDALEWPSNKTELVSRFAPASQYMIGPKFCSAYHLGDGYVGTAGHCFDTDGQLGELRVVFNWVGDVASKKTFTESEVFKIERVVLCDTHGPAPTPTELVATAPWSRRWDSAILRLKGTPYQFSHLKSAKYATKPPEFGTSVYNIGCPLGTQLKTSASAHILRHSLLDDDNSPFSQLIAGYGTFTTDLDQFEGNAASTNPILAHIFEKATLVAQSVMQIPALSSGILRRLKMLSQKAMQLPWISGQMTTQHSRRITPSLQQSIRSWKNRNQRMIYIEYIQSSCVPSRESQEIAR